MRLAGFFYFQEHLCITTIHHLDKHSNTVICLLFGHFFSMLYHLESTTEIQNLTWTQTRQVLPQEKCV